MKNEAVLLEAVALADEILDSGPAEGRGIRLAALVLKLNENMMQGDVPLSWREEIPTHQVLKSLPPPPPLPEFRSFLASIPEEDELDAAWDKLTSKFPPPPDSGEWIEITDEDVSS